MKHTPRRLVKEAYVLALERQPQRQPSGLAHLEVYGRARRERRLEDAIFVLPLCLTTAHQYHPEVSVYAHLEPQFLQLLPREQLQINWLRGPARLTHVVPQDCTYLHYLKAVT